MNTLKRYICDVKNLGLWHDLPISVNKLFHHFTRVVFSQNIAYMGSFAKIKPSQKFMNLQYINLCLLVLSYVDDFSGLWKYCSRLVGPGPISFRTS